MKKTLLRGAFILLGIFLVFEVGLKSQKLPVVDFD